MKRLTLLEKKIIMQKPDSLHNYFGWPTLARLQGGALAVAASGFRFGHLCPFGKAVISYSYDEGATWTEPSAVIDTLLDDRDGGLLCFGESGVIYTSFNNSIAQQKKWVGDTEGARADYIRAYLALAEQYPEVEKEQLGATMKFSRDGGMTWEKKIYRTAVSTPHGPMIAPDGSVLYIGNVPGDLGRVECWRVNTDNGEMTKVGSVPQVEGGALPTDEVYGISLKDGRILLVIRTEKQPENPTWDNGYEMFTVYQCFSSDGGKSWTEPTLLPLAEGEDASPKNLGAPPHLYRDSKGRLILSTATRLPPFGINILVSEDEGSSWRVYHLTDDAPNADLGYPSTTELSDGSFYTAWYQHPDKNSPAVIYGARWRFEEDV